MKVQALILATILLVSCARQTVRVSEPKMTYGSHWTAVEGDRSKSSPSCQKNPRCVPLVVLVPGPQLIEEAMRELCKEQKSFVCVGPDLRGTVIIIERYRQ